MPSQNNSKIKCHLMGVNLISRGHSCPLQGNKLQQKYQKQSLNCNILINLNNLELTHIDENSSTLKFGIFT